VVGDLVRRGEAIAQVGSVGNSSGAHLHLEVRDDLTPALNCPPYGTTLALFEAQDPEGIDGVLLECYEPKSGDKLRSNNLPWP